jgi:hypothetical protein
MAHSASTDSERHVKAVLESSPGAEIAVYVATDPGASFDCSTVQEAVRQLIQRHSNGPAACEVVIWNRLAPDIIDDVVACVRDLGCEVLSEHEDHVRFRLVTH